MRSTGSEAGPNSASTCRQAPQGGVAGEVPLATTTASIRLAPASTAAATALRSAQIVRP